MRAELAVVAVLLGGCSVVTMERLEDGYRRPTTPRCTASAMPMLLDGAVAVLAGVASGTMAVVGERKTVASSMAPISAVTVASAVYGWVQAGRCREAFAAHDRFLHVQVRMEQPLGAPGAAEGE